MRKAEGAGLLQPTDETASGTSLVSSLLITCEEIIEKMEPGSSPLCIAEERDNKDKLK